MLIFYTIKIHNKSRSNARCSTPSLAVTTIILFFFLYLLICLISIGFHFEPEKKLLQYQEPLHYFHSIQIGSQLFQ